MKPVINPREWETISAYLDGQLSDLQKAAFDRELVARPELQQALQELQQLKLILHSVPLRKVRRNFMVKPGAVKHARVPVLVPVFRVASTVAGIAVVALLAIDLLPSVLSFGAMAPKAAAPAALAMEAQSEAAPQIVYWSGQTTSPTVAPLGLGGGGPGMGGGSDAPIYNNMATNTPTPQTSPAVMLAVPESTQSAEAFTKMDQSAQPTVFPTPYPTPTAQTGTFTTSERAADSSPILGIAPTEQQGTFSYTERAVPAESGSTPTFPTTRIVEIGLGLLAVALGVAAYLIRKKA